MHIGDVNKTDCYFLEARLDCAINTWLKKSVVVSMMPVFLVSEIIIMPREDVYADFKGH